VASHLKTDAWSIVRDNFLWSDQLVAGDVLRIREAPPPPQFITHVVRRGETLSGLASRYGTSVSRLQAENGMGRRTLLKIGQRLRVPR
jgi:LysM repeat protein